MRVIIAEDSVLLRGGMARLLEDAGIEIVAQVGDADALLAAVAEHDDVDLCLVDIRMPPTYSEEGMHAAIRIRAEHPDVAVLLLSQHVVGTYAAQLLGGGAAKVGYLLKDRVADIAEFSDALHRVAAGGTVLDPEVVAQLLVRRRAHDPLAALTPREREVLTLMAEGRSNTAIARTLVITEGAVEKHVANIFAKLSLPPDEDTNRRVLAVLTFLRG